MKTNAKVVMWAFVAMPFVVALVAFSTMDTRETQVVYALGPVTWSEMAGVVGGATEGPGCYREIDSDCGGQGGKPDRTCPSHASSCGYRTVYYAIYKKRSKKLFEKSNTLADDTLYNQRCYDERACVATKINDKEYNGDASSPECITKVGSICYNCANPSLSGASWKAVSDYRCVDP